LTEQQVANKKFCYLSYFLTASTVCWRSNANDVSDEPDFNIVCQFNIVELGIVGIGLHSLSSFSLSLLLCMQAQHSISEFC